MNSLTVLKRKSTLSAFALLVSGVMLAPGAQAQTIPLADGNSLATVNLGGGSGAVGMNSWLINGQSQLSQQWFWYRVGTTPQASIDTISLATVNSVSANFLSATYTDANHRFSINVSYFLQGGTPGTWNSDMSESISVANLTGAPLDFHFFQYSDFDLAGSNLGDQVSISKNLGPPVSYWRALQTKANTPTQLAETMDLPFADHAEAALAGATLTSLNGGPYTLNDNLTAGPGDVTWAFEWDTSIAANSSLDIIKDKKLEVAPIPEPATLGLLSLGLIALALRRQRATA